MMTDDEILAVVQAHKEGKKIEVRVRESLWWNEFKYPSWNFMGCDYRVAPEPRLIKGFCFARDIHETPTIGMLKVEQVPLLTGENPIQPRKPREWEVFVDRVDTLFLSPLVDRTVTRIKVREVIE